MKPKLTAERARKIREMKMTTEETIAITKKYCANNYSPIPVTLERGEGVWLWDVEGKKYLDMMSCYSAVSLGHCDPEVVKTAINQVKKLANVSRAYYTSSMAKFIWMLSELCGKEKILPMNTGAEAVETALKIARKWAYSDKKGILNNCAELIVCSNNFHGRTITIVSFSSEFQYKNHFGPHTPGFRAIPFNSPEDLEDHINTNTAAFLVEPIQGEAGIVIPNNGYLQTVREICTRKNILLIADEIQTGFSRTGKLFACEREEVVPDIYIFGKALGGGVMPVSAVAANADIMDVIKPGDHGSTFGGGALASEVACASIERFVSGKYSEKAVELGDYLMAELKKIQSPRIKEIRGVGLFIGLELTRESGGARRYCEALAKEGVLSKETHDYVIRFAPPLIITKEELNWALARIKKVFAELS